MEDARRLLRLDFAFSHQAVLGRVEGVLVEVGQGDLDPAEVRLGQVVARADADVEMLPFANVAAEPWQRVVGHGASPGVGGHDAEHPPVVDDQEPRLAVDGRPASAGFRRRGFRLRLGPDRALGHGGGGSMGEGTGHVGWWGPKGDRS